MQKVQKKEKKTINMNQSADGPSLLRNLFSIIFVTVFLLAGFVGAFLLKQYLNY